MVIWHLTPDAPRFPFFVSSGQNVNLQLGTWPFSPGSRNPRCLNSIVKANGTLVTAHASYYVTENVRAVVEFTKVSGEGQNVQRIGEPNGVASSSQERYLVGIHFAF